MLILIVSEIYFLALSEIILQRNGNKVSIENRKNYIRY